MDGTRIMVEGGPWEGTARDTQVVLAGGDTVACDVVGLAMIKSFGCWERLASRSPREMRQVKRAVEIGLGATSLEQMEILEGSLAGDPDFAQLMERVRTLLA